MGAMPTLVVGMAPDFPQQKLNEAPPSSVLAFSCSGPEIPSYPSVLPVQEGQKRAVKCPK